MMLSILSCASATIADYFNVDFNFLIGKDEAENDDFNEQGFKVALFGGSGEVTEEMWDEVKQFAKFVSEREKNKKSKK